MSKSNITQTMNQTQSEQPSKIVYSTSHNSNNNGIALTTQTKLSGYQQIASAQAQSHAQSNTLSKVGSSQISIGHSINGTGIFTQQQIQNTQNLNIPSGTQAIQSSIQNYQTKKPQSAQTQQQLSRKAYTMSLNHIQEEEEKVLAPTQSSQHPQKPLISYEAVAQDRQHQHQQLQPKTNHIAHSQQPISRISQESHNNTRHKPSSSQYSGTGQPKILEGRSENGEKMLNKRHQMRMTSGESNKATPHNITRSLIDEGSEDFTSIEEHIQEDTRISCRNAVASSLNNVSQIIKQGLIQQNLRNRRGTTQSNMTNGPSNQPSKEETFESSSFFDEGVGGQHRIIQQQINGQNLIAPHRCNQIEGYNIPTIFNTLMFGIDQSKVSSNVRESFSKVQGSPQTQNTNIQSKQYQDNNNSNNKEYQKQLSNQFAKKQAEKAKYTSQVNNQQQQQPIINKNSSKEKLSQLVTKVDKPPIMVFDQNQIHRKQVGTQKQQQQQQPSRNQEKLKQSNSQSTNQIPKSSIVQQQQQQTPTAGQGRLSQLSMAAQQNLKIEQQIEPPESLTTEVISNRNQEDFDNEENNNDIQSEEIIQKTVNQIEDFQTSELHRNHLIQTLQSLQYIKTLPPVNKNDVKQRCVKLPPFRSSHIKKTIIFDLDETLVHCIDDIENYPCDQVINVTFPNGETVQAGINIRPYALECLKKANENYQVVVFTASHKAYADVVLDHLDPDRSLIQYRLYRDHCIRTEEGIYIKDLRIITNRQLKDLIIVDNAVYSFGYQLDNGIPIIPFYDDKTDEELMHLIFYINCLANCQDVREQNRKAFQLKDLQEIDIAEYLQSMMNPNGNVVQEEDDGN